MRWKFLNGSYRVKLLNGFEFIIQYKNFACLALGTTFDYLSLLRYGESSELKSN